MMSVGNEDEYPGVDLIWFITLPFLSSRVLRGVLSSMKGGQTPLRITSKDVSEKAGVIRGKDIPPLASTDAP
jgi:hypothetical protein